MRITDFSVNGVHIPKTGDLSTTKFDKSFRKREEEYRREHQNSFHERILRGQLAKILEPQKSSRRAEQTVKKLKIGENELLGSKYKKRLQPFNGKKVLRKSNLRKSGIREKCVIRGKSTREKSIREKSRYNKYKGQESLIREGEYTRRIKRFLDPSSFKMKLCLPSNRHMGSIDKLRASARSSKRRLNIATDGLKGKIWSARGIEGSVLKARPTEKVEQLLKTQEENYEMLKVSRKFKKYSEYLKSREDEGVAEKLNLNFKRFKS